MNYDFVWIGTFAVCIVYFFAVELCKEWKKKSQPIHEVKATIVSFRLYSLSTTGGKWGRTSVQSWLATFRLAGGETVELSCPEDIATIPAGTTGTLIYQGEKCEKFIPYGKEEQA